MSLVTAKPMLIADLLAMFEEQSTATDNPQQSRQKMAEKLADAIEKFVKEGKVMTTGSATAQTGTIT